MYIYAQINQNSEVYSINDLSGIENNESLIPIPFFADDLLNSTFENGDFIRIVEEVKYKFNFDSKSWEVVK